MVTRKKPFQRFVCYYISMILIDEHIKGSRCLVAGGSGFIGTCLVRKLVKAGAKEVVIISRTVFDGEHIPQAIRYVICDLEQTESQHIIRKLGNFDYVFNLIGVTDQTMPYSNPSLLYAANVQTLIHLTQGIEWGSVRGGVHVGSNAEYGDAPVPHKEHNALHPTNMYGWTKMSGSVYAEMMTHLGLAKWSVARPFFVYGRGQQKGLVAGLIKTFMRGDTFTITGSEVTRDPVFVEDVAEGLMRLAVSSKAQGEVVNLCMGKEIRIRDIAKLVHRLIPLGNIAVQDVARMGDFARSVGSVKKLKRLTEWQPQISLKEGLAKIIKKE